MVINIYVSKKEAKPAKKVEMAAKK